MSWSKYSDLEPVKRLRNEGRELIGKVVLFTEKRDGENVSIWLDKDDAIRVSSHNLEKADDNIVNRFMNTPEYRKACELLFNEREYNKNWVLYGELLKGISPTRIEPRRKHIHWVLFDMRNMETGKFADYSYVYQMGYHFKIPVVNTVGEILVESVEHLQSVVAGALKWCRRHRREGVVGKCYGDDIFFKEKIDLPKRPKFDRPQKSQIQLPEMPPEKVFRALQHAYDEIGADNWLNKAVAMPAAVKHINVEAIEHNYSPPKNIYQYYIDTPLVKLMEVARGQIAEERAK